MRGPWFSGAIGSAATVGRLMELLRGRAPVVVLSTEWLAEVLAAETPGVLLLVEPDRENRGRRADKRARRRGHRLLVAQAGAEIPLVAAGAAAIVIDELNELPREEAREFVATVAACLRPGGLLLSLDATKDVADEAALSACFLAAKLRDIGQDRPKEGAVMTVGVAPSFIAASTPAP